MQEWCAELITVQDIKKDSALEGNHKDYLPQLAEQWCLFIYTFGTYQWISNVCLFSTAGKTHYISHALSNF